MKMSIFGHFYRKCLILIYWSSLLLYYHKHIFQAVWHSINIYCLNKKHTYSYEPILLKSRSVSKTFIFALDSSLVRMKPSRWFLPHTYCDASVTTLMHLFTACVWHGSKLIGGTVNCRTPFLFGWSLAFRTRRRASSRMCGRSSVIISAGRFGIEQNDSIRFDSKIISIRFDSIRFDSMKLFFLFVRFCLNPFSSPWLR